MDTFFQLLSAPDRNLAPYKNIPLLLRIYWRGTWEKWHAQFNTAGNHPDYKDRMSDNSTMARRKGRNCKWDDCDCNAANNSGVPSMVYDY